MPVFLKKTILLLTMLMASTGLYGNVYFWTDDTGVKHFSNISPPLGVDAGGFKEEVSQALARVKKEDPVFTVTQVFDGDTIMVRGLDLVLKIRLAGIDSPETKYKKREAQPYGEKAKQHLTRLLNHRKVALKSYGIGGFNRVLAEVFVGTTNVNLEMIRSGLAEVYRGRPPKGLDLRAYDREEKTARSAQRGMWSLGRYYTSPKTWRRKHPIE